MPLVQISVATGRTRAQKDDLAHRITRAVCDSLSAPVESVRVILTEVAEDDWFAGGVSLKDRRKPKGA